MTEHDLDVELTAVELTEQLQGRADRRQVAGARIGLAHNGGGTIGIDAAATCVTVLTR